MSDEAHHPKFEKLIAFLSRIPAVDDNDTPSRGFGWMGRKILQPSLSENRLRDGQGLPMLSA